MKGFISNGHYANERNNINDSYRMTTFRLITTNYDISKGNPVRIMTVLLTLMNKVKYVDIK